MPLCLGCHRAEQEWWSACHLTPSRCCGLTTTTALEVSPDDRQHHIQGGGDEEGHVGKQCLSASALPPASTSRRCHVKSSIHHPYDPRHDKLFGKHGVMTCLPSISVVLPKYNLPTSVAFFTFSSGNCSEVVDDGWSGTDTACPCCSPNMVFPRMRSTAMMKSCGCEL